MRILAKHGDPQYVHLIRDRDPCVVTIEPMNDVIPETRPPRYCHPAALWRRLLWIMICGLIAVPTIVFAVWRLILRQPVQFNAGFALFVAAGCTVLLLMLRARIRIDGHGIALRGWLGWRNCPWLEIASRPTPLLCVGQEPWSVATPRIRRLYRALYWLEEEERLALYQSLTPAGTRVHLPETPGRFRLQIFGLRWLELDADELRLEGDGGVETWRWSDVELVKVRKESNATPAVDAIRFKFADGREFSINSSPIECDCPCQCRHDFLLLTFLRRALRDDQLLIWAQRGEPASVAEARYRLGMTESELKTSRICARCYGIAVGGLWAFGLAAGADRFLRLGIQLLAYGVFFGPAVWGIFRQQRQLRDMLRDYLDARTHS